MNLPSFEQITEWDDNDFFAFFENTKETNWCTISQMAAHMIGAEDGSLIDDVITAAVAQAYHAGFVLMAKALGLGDANILEGAIYEIVIENKRKAVGIDGVISMMQKINEELKADTSPSPDSVSSSPMPDDRGRCP